MSHLRGGTSRNGSRPFSWKSVGIGQLITVLHSKQIECQTTTLPVFARAPAPNANTPLSIMSVPKIPLHDFSSLLICSCCSSVDFKRSRSIGFNHQTDGNLNQARSKMPLLCLVHYPKTAACS